MNHRYLLFPLALLTATTTIALEQPGLIINEDNSHFFSSRPAEAMSLEGLHAFVDQYADTKVSHLFLSPNSMRASFKSATREAIWELGDQEMPPPGMGQAWMKNARILHEKGLDPYAVWIARAREKGISPWLSMRMNDIHDVPNPKSYMHSTFWLEHPEFWRVPNDSSGGWTARALDYAHAEVREHNMAFVKELLERYDPDGLELDWMRFGWHFKAGEEAEGVAILTEFVREVRALTRAWGEKRGHPIQLGVRVPAHPDAARGLGMDGVQWAKEGLVDRIVPCPFWTTTDFDIPVELWRKQLGAAADDVVIAPGIEFNSRAYPGATPTANDLAATRGFAASAWHRGADQIYLFNYMDSDTRPVSEGDYHNLLQQGLAPDVVANLPRRYIQTFRDTVPSGFPNGVVLPATGPEARFALNIGPKPTGAETAIQVGLGNRPGVHDAEYRAKINGTATGDAEVLDNPGQFPHAVRALRFPCPPEAVRAGRNEIILQLPVEQQLIWVELVVTPP